MKMKCNHLGLNELKENKTEKLSGEAKLSFYFQHHPHSNGKIVQKRERKIGLFEIN